MLRKTKTDGAFALTAFDSIFNTGVSDADISGDRVVEISIAELFPPDFHPFLVSDDAAMDRLVKSVKKYGVREPGLARPRADGGYELLSGNRRKRACELAGIATMPIIIREMDDDSAAIAMVDANIEQRESLLFSEKSWAYRIKLEALNHRGIKSDNLGQPSVEILCEQTGECRNKIFRLIRLTELVPALIDMVDSKRLAFSPAVELSYLTRPEQALVADTLERFVVKPSFAQATRLKKASQEGGLALDQVESILTSVKKPSNDALASVKRFVGYFPIGYTPEQMENVIVKLLSDWRARQSVLAGEGGVS